MLAGVEIEVRSISRAFQQVAEGVVGVAVRNSAASVRQLTDAAVAVVAVEAGANGLRLGDQVEAVGVLADDRAELCLIQDLGITGEVVGVYEVLRGDTTSGLADAVAIAVIDDGDRAALDEPVLEVIDVRDRTRRRGVAVGVVGLIGFGGLAIVGLVMNQRDGRDEFMRTC